MAKAAPKRATPKQAKATPVAPRAPRQATPVETKKPWWRHTWAIVSAAVGVVGAVTGVISVLPLVFRDATTLDSLTVSVEPADSAFAPVFAVPIETDWATFPASQAGCDPTQLSWLEANGIPLAERFLVSVANSAGEGAMMSLKDFRGLGDPVAAAPTHVAVTCAQNAAAGPNLRAAALDPATGRTAVYVQPDPSLPDNPLVFNLAPGENGQFALSIRSSAAFSGTIVFTAALGTESRQLELPVGELELPGMAPIGLTVVDGVLACDGHEDCSAADLLASLR